MPDIETTAAGSGENMQVGTVLLTHGSVKAVSPDGSERILAAADPVFAGEQIVTGENGRVSVLFDDAAQTRLDVGRESTVALTEDVYQGAPPEDISEVTAEVEAIQQALVTGDIDPTTDLEPPAAGGEAAGMGGSREIIVDELDAPEQPVVAGAETTGVGYNFLDPEIPPGIVPPGGPEPGDTDD
ncbi:MAG: retention module-containing protein, partial [Deltaproteobacteria bacterium]|nr:retention module-containing protein [Deltaproteobacteria bacterium]